MKNFFYDYGDQKSELLLQNIAALANDPNSLLYDGYVIPCAINFQYDPSGYWWVNCLFCDADLKGWHDGSDICTAH
jgi:hypothetical protein